MQHDADDFVESADEEIIAVGHPTMLPEVPFLVLFGGVAVASLFAGEGMVLPILLPCLGALLITVIWMLWRVYSHTYTITTERIIAKCGLLNVDISEIRLGDIRGIHVSKTLFGRIFGYSSASIGTAATQGMEIVIANVTGLDAIIREINELRS